MLRTQRLVGVLRILLGLAFVALVLAQVAVLPAVFSRIEEPSQLADLRWLLLTLSVLELLCVQVVIACTWRLLTMVRDDRIFSDGAMVWVNAIVAAMAGAWLLVVAGLLYVVAAGGSLGLAVALLLVLVGGAVVGLLMVVMRALLRQATMLRSDMEAVI